MSAADRSALPSRPSGVASDPLGGIAGLRRDRLARLREWLLARNSTFYRGQLPQKLTLDTAPIASWGEAHQDERITIDTTLVDHGSDQALQDIATHEALHVAFPALSHGSRGFRREANRIGRTLDLPPLPKRRKGEKAIGEFWPMCLRDRVDLNYCRHTAYLEQLRADRDAAQARIEAADRRGGAIGLAVELGVLVADGERGKAMALCIELIRRLQVAPIEAWIPKE